MNIFRKLFIPSGEQEEILVYESWIVKWESRKGQHSGDVDKEMEIFTSKEDAEKFAEQLRKAFKLIRHTSGTHVKVEKNSRE